MLDGLKMFDGLEALNGLRLLNSLNVIDVHKAFNNMLDGLKGLAVMRFLVM